MLRNLRIFKKKEKIWLKTYNSALAGKSRFLENEMCTNEKAKQTFFTTPACTCTADSKVIQISHNPGFIC